MKFITQPMASLVVIVVIFSLVVSGSMVNSQDRVTSSDSSLYPRKGLVKHHRLTKADLDGDVNYDGIIDNDDPTDNGRNQTTPPGLQIGVGELSKMVIRFKTYDPDYEGELILRLEVAGINRDESSGEFSSLAEETKSTGRIRVWDSPKKTKLFLDSSDANKRVFEWIGDREKIRTGEPGGFPRTVYVEGVGVSGEHDGDLRLLLKSLHHKKPEDLKKEPYLDAADHVLVTVRPKPMKKDFVNNNAEAVWVGGGAAATAVGPGTK